ncbi:hypothetical protein [Thermomonospora umbrina]|uniref:Uncharacterized protein n=1 Tax=Thermomonospora umbrina TaxID=111806 RepID=A0A3D9T1U4_9ACTN|nr:hypothetical protein [Thermomonospora umbrina]REE97791.1 hypothetical protein DFJ69_3266 [Thermomonospora umbrina]
MNPLPWLRHQARRLKRPTPTTTRHPDPTPYDPSQRAVANELARVYAGRWLVMWGVASRRYWAAPCWPDAPSGWLDAPTVEALQAAMVEVEIQSIRHPAGTWRAA